MSENNLVKNTRASAAKEYPSKVSGGLLVFIAAVFYIPLVPIILSDGFGVAVLGIIGFLTLLFAFILHIFFTTVYTIKGNRLYIKCGFIRYQPIDIDEIREISKTRSILSSPAASFDRIKIKYGKFDDIIISPKRKVSFVEELTKTNPNIKHNLTED